MYFDAGFNIETLKYKGINFNIWDVSGGDRIVSDSSSILILKGDKVLGNNVIHIGCSHMVNLNHLKSMCTHSFKIAGVDNFAFHPFFCGIIIIKKWR